jgi:NAD(P)H-flavin reductase
MASKAADVIGTQPLLPQPWVVSEVTRETDDVVTLTIQPGEGVGPMAFKPGQFNMLYAFGTGEVPISISGDPTQDAHGWSIPCAQSASSLAHCVRSGLGT